ncbi:MAG: hypothetical protein SPL21_12045 [Fibrobacter sp.]|nr:hypothetical protein [Fibrobacter sp.]
MKKNIIECVIRYGEKRALSVIELDNGSPLRIKRLKQLTEAYFDKILEATWNMRHKKV